MTSQKKPHLGFYSSAYIRILFDYLQAHGHDAPAVLGEPSPALYDQGLTRYSAEKWKILLERAADVLNDPFLGLHLGQCITPAHLGVIGYVLMSCDTLGSALYRTQQYELLISDVAKMRICIDGLFVQLTWEDARGSLGSLVDETALTAFVQFARYLAVDNTQPPNLVSFSTPSPINITPYINYFGCPVLFDQEETYIRAPLELLAMPLRQADATLLDMMEQRAANLLHTLLPASNDFVQSVRTLIARLARENNLTIERAASSLCLSPRTLHRRLAIYHWSFRDLRDDTRKRLACDYLSDTRLTLSEVAWLLGYSELSAFTRSFKRWTGLAPSSWREQRVEQAISK